MLISNWRDIALRAHSMWAQYLGVSALVAPEVIYLMLETDTNPKAWFWTGLALMVYGMIGRLWSQGIDEPKADYENEIRSSGFVGVFALALVFSMSQLVIAPGESVEAINEPVAVETDAEFMAVAVPLIGKWEGLRLNAYLDIVGVPTVCYGETKGVQLGDSYTKAECDEMLAREIRDYRDRLRPSFTKATVSAFLTPFPGRDAAHTSVAYNVGVGAYGGSTAVKRLNAGDVAGSCTALTWWNKAGGRVVRGLVNRRKDEYKLCMQGVA